MHDSVPFHCPLASQKNEAEPVPIKPGMQDALQLDPKSVLMQLEIEFAVGMVEEHVTTIENRID